MGLTINWTDFAENELKEIFEYYKEVASITVARKLVSGIVKETLKLKKIPTICQEEELLNNDPREFRYLVYKNYKIIYLIDFEINSIEVYDVFDTRQNPIKMKRKT
jgi:plasmid stabilization system protein ParE